METPTPMKSVCPERIQLRPAPPALSATMPTTARNSSQQWHVARKSLKQFLPDATQKARDTIRGKVRVSVKVHVDESGGVTAAASMRRGPANISPTAHWKPRNFGCLRPRKWMDTTCRANGCCDLRLIPTAINVYPAQIAPEALRTERDSSQHPPLISCALIPACPMPRPADRGSR